MEVNVLLKVASPYEFWNQTRRSVEFHRIVDRPERGFQILYNKGENQAIREILRRKYNAV